MASPFSPGRTGQVVLRTRTRGQENYLRIDEVTRQIHAGPDYPARLNLGVQDSPGSLLGWMSPTRLQPGVSGSFFNNFGFDVPPSSQGEPVPLRILTPDNWNALYRAVIVWSDEENLDHILSWQQQGLQVV